MRERETEREREGETHITGALFHKCDVIDLHVGLLGRQAESNHQIVDVGTEKR